MGKNQTKAEKAKRNRENANLYRKRTAPAGRGRPFRPSGMPPFAPKAPFQEPAADAAASAPTEE